MTTKPTDDSPRDPLLDLPACQPFLGMEAMDAYAKTLPTNALPGACGCSTPGCQGVQANGFSAQSLFPTPNRAIVYVHTARDEDETVAPNMVLLACVDRDNAPLNRTQAEYLSHWLNKEDARREVEAFCAKHGQAFNPQSPVFYSLFRPEA